MSLNIQEINDAHADRVFSSLQKHLREWFLVNAPDWHLHHMGLCQDLDNATFQRRAKVLLHLYPCKPGPYRNSASGEDLPQLQIKEMP
jgi:hypothetical protein